MSEQAAFTFAARLAMYYVARFTASDGRVFDGFSFENAASADAVRAYVADWLSERDSFYGLSASDSLEVVAMPEGWEPRRGVIFDGASYSKRCVDCGAEAPTVKGE